MAENGRTDHKSILQADASGKVDLPLFVFNSPTVTIFLDGRRVGSASDAKWRIGKVGLGTKADSVTRFRKLTITRATDSKRSRGTAQGAAAPPEPSRLCNPGSAR